METVNIGFGFQKKNPLVDVVNVECVQCIIRQHRWMRYGSLLFEPITNNAHIPMMSFRLRQVK